MDEIPQLFNVITGSMSLVGPRPNVESEVNQYTAEELNILKVNPGITDFASIVFNDEGSILLNSKNPDLDYNTYYDRNKGVLLQCYYNSDRPNSISDVTCTDNNNIYEYFRLVLSFFIPRCSKDVVSSKIFDLSHV